MRQSCSLATSTERTKLTFTWHSWLWIFSIGPISVQPRAVHIMTYSSSPSLRLSSNTQKASGALLLMINWTSFSLILGSLMSSRLGHLLASCSDGILRLEAFNLSTAHSLLTSTFQYRQVALRLG